MDPGDIETTAIKAEPVTKPARYFRKGRFFAVVWYEPSPTRLPAETASESESVSANLGPFSEVRLFIVIHTTYQACLCVAVHTYGGRGVTKTGLNLADHAIVYEFRSPPPEAEAPMRESIAVVTEDDSQFRTLRPNSLANFGKIYTVEHNIPVANIGYVHRDHIKNLKIFWDTVEANGTSKKIEKLHQLGAFNAKSSNNGTLAISHLSLTGEAEPFTAKCEQGGRLILNEVRIASTFAELLVKGKQSEMTMATMRGMEGSEWYNLFASTEDGGYLQMTQLNAGSGMVKLVAKEAGSKIKILRLQEESYNFFAGTERGGEVDIGDIRAQNSTIELVAKGPKSILVVKRLEGSGLRFSGRAENGGKLTIEGMNAESGRAELVARGEGSTIVLQRLDLKTGCLSGRSECGGRLDIRFLDTLNGTVELGAREAGSKTTVSRLEGERACLSGRSEGGGQLAIHLVNGENATVELAARDEGSTIVVQRLHGKMACLSGRSEGGGELDIRHVVATNGTLDLAVRDLGRAKSRIAIKKLGGESVCLSGRVEGRGRLEVQGEDVEINTGIVVVRGKGAELLVGSEQAYKPVGEDGRPSTYFIDESGTSAMVPDSGRRPKRPKVSPFSENGDP